MKKVFDRIFWLYMALGFLNYFTCSAVMLALRNIVQLSELACLMIAFALQTAVSFLLNRYVTFRGIEIHEKWPLFFVLTVAVCYLVAKVLLRDVYAWLINQGIFAAISDWLQQRIAASTTTAHFRTNLVMLATTFTYCVVNYLGQRYFVFRPKVHHPEGEPAF